MVALRCTIRQLTKKVAMPEQNNQRLTPISGIEENIDADFRLKPTEAPVTRAATGFQKEMQARQAAALDAIKEEAAAAARPPRTAFEVELQGGRRPLSAPASAELSPEEEQQIVATMQQEHPQSQTFPAQTGSVTPASAVKEKIKPPTTPAVTPPPPSL
jgi:hypothetical protein